MNKQQFVQLVDSLLEATSGEFSEEEIVRSVCFSVVDEIEATKTNSEETKELEVEQ